MSPLMAPPLRGYADEQRVNNWDTGLLYSENTGLVTHPVTSPILDVSREGYLGGYVTSTSAQWQAAFTWYLDAGGTEIVGVRNFILDSNIPNPAQLRFPNIGPFVELQIEPVAGLEYDAAVLLFGTNRVHPLEFIPTSSYIMDRQGAALGAMTTINLYPSDYYSGPITIWFQPAFASWAISLEAPTVANTWDLVNHASGTSAVDVPLAWVTPPGAWRIVVGNNTAAASSFYIAAIPSSTGAT